MDISTLQFIQITSFAPAALILVWKVLIPLTNLLIARLNRTDTSADARLCKIENDFTHEIRTDIAEMKTNIENLRIGFGKLELKVAVLEEKVK